MIYNVIETYKITFSSERAIIINLILISLDEKYKMISSHASHSQDILFNTNVLFSTNPVSARRYCL